MSSHQIRLEQRLVEVVATALIDMGVSYLPTELKQTRFSDYVPFKLSEKRTVCYIQFLNKAMPDDKFNLVVRLKRDDRPSSWKGEPAKIDLLGSIADRFIRPWSEERGYPKSTWNDKGPTQQFAIDLFEGDVTHADFGASLKLLLRISHAAVTRDWTTYNTLTQG